MPVASSVMAHEREEASVPDWQAIPCCRTSRHSGRPSTKGRHVMPPLKGALTEQQMADIQRLVEDAALTRRL